MSVVGSHSGNHPGKLKRYSTGTGASFVPNRPFRAGEQVAVHALVGVGGATPAKPVTTIFTIAHQASVSQTQFPKETGRLPRDSALRLGAHPDSLDREDHDARPARPRRAVTCSWRPTRAWARPGR